MPLQSILHRPFSMQSWICALWRYVFFALLMIVVVVANISVTTAPAPSRNATLEDSTLSESQQLIFELAIALLSAVLFVIIVAILIDHWRDRAPHPQPPLQPPPHPPAQLPQLPQQPPRRHPPLLPWRYPPLLPRRHPPRHPPQHPTQPPIDIELFPMITVEGDHVDLDGRACAFCLDEFHQGVMLRSFPCPHYYHDECCRAYFASGGSTCPECQFNLRTVT